MSRLDALSTTLTPFLTESNARSVMPTSYRPTPSLRCELKSLQRPARQAPKVSSVLLEPAATSHTGALAHSAARKLVALLLPCIGHLDLDRLKILVTHSLELRHLASSQPAVRIRTAEKSTLVLVNPAFRQRSLAGLLGRRLPRSASNHPLAGGSPTQKCPTRLSQQKYGLQARTTSLQASNQATSRS